MRRLRSLSIVGTLTILVATGSARASDSADSVRAAALLAEGRQLMTVHDYAAACPKLAESEALYPARDTALDLGICYQKASELAFEIASDAAQSSRPVGVTTSSRSLALPAEEPASGSTQRTVGLAVGGVGVAGIAAGVIMAVVARSAYEHALNHCVGGVCPVGAVSQGNSAAGLVAASTVSLIAGAVALGTGAVVFFTVPKAKASVGASVGLGLAAEGASVSIAGRF